MFIVLLWILIKTSYEVESIPLSCHQGKLAKYWQKWNMIIVFTCVYISQTRLAKALERSPEPFQVAHIDYLFI